MTRIPVIHTERLTMRAPRLSDFDAYAEFRASERSAGIGGPHVRSDSFDMLCEIAGHWLIRGYGRWMIADKDTDEPLGVVGLMYPEGWPEAEIAWMVFEAGEGKGLAMEAALASRDFAYNVLGWKTVISCTMPGNDRSVTLAKRMGAVQEADCIHPTIGLLNVWRHLSPEAVQ